MSDSRTKRYTANITTELVNFENNQNKQRFTLISHLIFYVHLISHGAISCLTYTHSTFIPVIGGRRTVFVQTHRLTQRTFNITSVHCFNEILRMFLIPLQLSEQNKAPTEVVEPFVVVVVVLLCK